MIQKLEAIYHHFEEIGKQLTDPSVISNTKKFIQLNREYKELEPVVQAYQKYLNLDSNIKNAKDILQNEKDEDFRAMAKEELEMLESERKKLEEMIKVLMLPKDPEDRKNCVVEIRAGTGGDEASIFAGDLYKMYTRYAESRGWKVELVDYTPGTMGGYKEIIFNIIGENAYGTMKFESGVHRVQRVPQTESQGRIHTSAASVVVLPEAEELDIEIKDSDIRKDTFCSSGAGGQSVNTTYSAVRLTHIPTGIVATCQDEKSQTKNLEKAMKVLRSRIYEIELQKKLEEVAGKRKTMVSTGDRSAKIRTYNYPQGRVTDHRINFSSHNLPSVMNGDIQDFIDELMLVENSEKMKESNLF